MQINKGLGQRMILVNCSIAQTDIIKLISEYKVDGEYIFRHLKTEGIKIYFNSTLNDDYKACDIISNIIRGHKYGPIIFFNVVPVYKNEIKWF